MIEKNNINCELICKLKDKFLEYGLRVEIPPPVFVEMDGEVLCFDESKQRMKIKFPVASKYNNPFGNMQGGMIAAAIDNTFGPLSMLIAPPNFTRNMDIKFKKTINSKTVYIIVDAQINEISDRKVILKANVLNSYGKILAMAKAVNWII
jgi:acyl-coenzyme A thioesterase PaaI-like protein